MANKRIILLSASGVISVLLVSVFVMWQQSLWVVWQLLPAAPLRVAAQTEELKAWVSAMQQITAATQTADIRQFAPHAYALGYARAGSEETFVIWPYWSQRETVMNLLQEHPWPSIAMVGPYIRASSNRQVQRRVAWHQILPDLLRRPWATEVILQAASGALATLDEPVAAVGRYRGDHWQAVVAASDQLPRRFSPTLAATLPAADTFSLVVAGRLLETLPPSVAAQLSSTITAWFGFTHTHPDIIKSLRNYEVVAIATENSGVSIAVTGDIDAFRQEVIGWLQEEERRTRPTRHAFALPDGTVGFESLPGELRADVLASVPGTLPCWQSVVTSYPWWLCAQGTTIAWAKDRSRAEAALQALPAPMSVRLGADFMTHVGWQNLTGLQVQGDDTQLHLNLFISSQHDTTGQ